MAQTTKPTRNHRDASRATVPAARKHAGGAGEGEDEAVLANAVFREAVERAEREYVEGKDVSAAEFFREMDEDTADEGAATGAGPRHK